MRKNKRGASSKHVVGYKRPPVGKRWKKGQSGNPKGRPKGTKPTHRVAVVCPHCKTPLVALSVW